MNTQTTDSKAEETSKVIEAAPNPEFAKRRRVGFFLVAMGAFLCIFGFLITLILLQQGANFNVALYGATGLGGTMLFGGLVAILA